VFFGNLFKGASQEAPKRVNSAELLRAAVHAHLPDADAEAVAFVTALAGLLASIAYADRDYSPAEQAHVREALASVHGLTEPGVEAISLVLKDHVRDLASINPQAFSRELRENGDVELRREVLDCLVDLGATDGELSLAETNLLRRTTSALGLEHNDYVVSQQRHRDKLKLGH
jgi:uncharacterized tellurite resistance protein B-like protein